MVSLDKSNTHAHGALMYALIFSCNVTFDMLSESFTRIFGMLHDHMITKS